MTLILTSPNLDLKREINYSLKLSLYRIKERNEEVIKKEQRREDPHNRVSPKLSAITKLAYLTITFRLFFFCYIYFSHFSIWRKKLLNLFINYHVLKEMRCQNKYKKIKLKIKLKRKKTRSINVANIVNFV